MPLSNKSHYEQCSEQTATALTLTARNLLLAWNSFTNCLPLRLRVQKHLLSSLCLCCVSPFFSLSLSHSFSLYLQKVCIEIQLHTCRMWWDSMRQVLCTSNRYYIILTFGIGCTFIYGTRNAISCDKTSYFNQKIIYRTFGMHTLAMKYDSIIHVIHRLTVCKIKRIWHF